MMHAPSPTEQPWYRRSELQTSLKQRASASQDVDMTRRRSAGTSSSDSKELCDFCQANVSNLAEASLVRPARDLNMDGYFAQDYEDLVFCSPSCAVSMFHAKEEPYVAYAMEPIAIQRLSATGRYEPGSFVKVPRGSRSGITLGADPEEERAMERDVKTKRRPVVRS